MVSKYINNFPEGYSPSKQQVKLIRDIEDAYKSGVKFVICSAPTGSGKSFISKTLANVSNEPSSYFKELVETYKAFKMDGTGGYEYEDECKEEKSSGAFALTITKSLQDQYLQLFKDSVVAKGKSNYVSTIDTNIDVEVENAIIPKKILEEHRINNKCPYHNARNKALIEKFGVLNYKMFLSLPAHVKRKNFIICDEASELEDEIIKQFSALIDPDRLKKYGVNSGSLYSTKNEAVLKWLYNTIVEISEHVTKLTNVNNKNNIEISHSDSIKLSYCKNLHRTLSLIIETWGDCEYITQRNEGIVSITPLKVDKLTKYIFNYGDKVLLMSATIIDHKHFAKTLGITDYKYIEVDSTFEAEKAPIYINTKHKINHYNLKKILPSIIKQIDNICKEHKNEKGIIHTHTGFITSCLKDGFRGNKRFLYRDQESRNEDILHEHSSSSEPTVLVSPSLGLGIDLKDDLARFQIIIKAPYLPLGDERIKKMFELDKQWYSNKMLSNVVQQCGRGIRSQEDHCKTYILDASIFQAILRNKESLPKYFLDRFV